MQCRMFGEALEQDVDVGRVDQAEVFEVEHLQVHVVAQRTRHTSSLPGRQHCRRPCPAQRVVLQQAQPTCVGSFPRRQCVHPRRVNLEGCCEAGPSWILDVAERQTRQLELLAQQLAQPLVAFGMHRHRRQPQSLQRGAPLQTVQEGVDGSSAGVHMLDDHRLQRWELPPLQSTRDVKQNATAMVQTSQRQVLHRRDIDVVESKGRHLGGLAPQRQLFLIKTNAQARPSPTPSLLLHVERHTVCIVVGDGVVCQRGGGDQVHAPVSQLQPTSSTFAPPGFDVEQTKTALQSPWRSGRVRRMRSSPAEFVPSKHLVVCILAGGAGTRFWPASLDDKPKQFLRLFSERSMLQQTYDRVSDLVAPERIFVLTSHKFSQLCQEQLPELPVENIIGEPMRRDTSAALALGAMVVRHRFDDAVMAVLTADHLIEPVEDFQKTVLSAARGAFSSTALYTFGIEPNHPATGYGYLEVGAGVDVEGESIDHHSLKRFVEKPDAATAQSYLDAGTFLWNSGMFVWRTSSLLNEIERQIPTHLTHLQPAIDAFGEDSFDAKLARAFEPLEKVSIDFGVMENAENVRCVRAVFSWFDVGSFNALADHYAKDDDGNASRTPTQVLDAHNNIVFSEDQHETVCLIGVDDLIVVRAGNKTLVVPKSRGQDIKKLVENLPDELR